MRGTLVGPNGGVSYGRGPNYARNAEVRRRRRERKQRGRVPVADPAVPEWRRGAASSVMSSDVGTARGYFADCSEDVRQRLRETRAARLVAENELAAAKANAEASSLTGAVTLVRQLNAVVRTAAELEKHTVDARVKSWARSVVEGAVSELSEKAPSSVPPLRAVENPPPRVAGGASLQKEKSSASRATTVSGVSLARGDPARMVVLDDLDPEDPATHAEINRRVAARKAAERAYNRGFY